MLRFVVVGVGVVAVAGCLAAQVKEDKVVPRAPEFVSVKDIVGTRVVFAAAKKGLEKKPVSAGQVTDLVLEVSTGITKFVAVAAARKTRAVPLASIRWSGRHWVLALGRKEFARLPTLPFRDLVAGGYAAEGGDYCYATKLAQAAVIAAKKKPAGAVEDILFDRFTLLPAFAMVRCRGEQYPVPAAAFDIRVDGQVGVTPKVLLDVTIAKLRAAPQTGAKKREKLTAQSFRNRVYKHFGVARPIFESPIEEVPVRERKRG